MSENTHVCDADGLVIKRRGGGSIVTLPPVFSLDAKILYVVWGKCIRAYSAQTGSFLLEFSELSSRCVSLQLLPKSDLLASCSEQGEIVFWDVGSSAVREKKVLEIPSESKVTWCYVLGKEKDVFVTLSNDEHTYQQMLRFKSSCKDYEVVNVKMNKSSNCVAVGGPENNKYLGTVAKCNVYALDIKKGKVVRLFVHSERWYTCIAAHETEQILAVGGKDGCITIWSAFFDHKNPPRDICHWHTLPVNAICFSEAGTAMFSGGGECVLVKWIFDLQEKSFLPRMGSPIKHVTMAPGCQSIAVSMADNSIQLVDSRLRVQKVIQYFTWNENIANKTAGYLGINKMRFDPKTKSLVLNGLSGHLQFFSTYSNSLLYNLDVVNQNFVTQEKNITIYNTEVMHVALSCYGNWMATTEFRRDPDFSLEARLKFWKFDKKKQNFSLNTCIESPHKGEIYALEMKPGTEDFFEMMAVTSGEGEMFKMWTLMENDEETSELWHLHGVGAYKGLPAGDIGFSSDGSILGAAFAHALTLWVPESHELKASLTHPDYQQNIRKVQFGSGDCCHLVVSVLPHCVVVWNLLSLTMIWTVSIEINILTADALSGYMAAFTSSGDLVIFKPSEPQPVLVKPQLSENEILLAAFIPLLEPRTDLMKWQHKSQLYFMNEHQELLVLEKPEDGVREAANGGGVQDGLGVNSDLNLTPLGHLLARVQKTSEVKPVVASDYSCDGIPGKEKIGELLRMPAHTMPALSSICYPFLTSLIRKTDCRGGVKGEDDDLQMEDAGSVIDDKDSQDGSDISGIAPGGVRDKIDSRDSKAKYEVIRPKARSTPELEAHLQDILNESVNWVKALQ